MPCLIGWRALARQVTGRTGWAKTARETESEEEQPAVLSALPGAAAGVPGSVPALPGAQPLPGPVDTLVPAWRTAVVKAAG